jgi:hypothetical protein
MKVLGKCMSENIWYTSIVEMKLTFGCVRFVHTPIDAINIRLSSEDQTLKKDISDLEKRLHYLETTHEKSREHIEQIFRGTGA